MKLFALFVIIALLPLIGAIGVDSLEETPSFLSSTWTKFKNWWSSSETEWSCGTRKIILSQDIAQFFTATACPALYATVNKACQLHDLCYESPDESRASCDDQFCLSMRSMDVDNETNCKIQDTFCYLVKKFGQLAYHKKSAELLANREFNI